MRYDIAIVGGGPAGYTAAERAAAGGLKTVLFEKESHRRRMPERGMYSHKNTVVFCQAVGYDERCCQVRHYRSRCARFRYGKDYRP